MTGESTVKVPRSLLEELVRCLEQAQEDMVAVPGNGLWSRSMVQRLRDEASQYRGARALGDLAARRAGDPDPVSLDEVVRTSGLTKKQVSSDLGAMSKAARRLFGEVRWPFRALDSAIGMTYLMTREIARWWLEDGDFWAEPSIGDLTSMQRVGAVRDLRDLAADIWESDDERREFLEDTYNARG